MSRQTPAARPASGLAVIPALLGLVRFPHTVFALPFAFAGALMATNAWPAGAVLGWILLAMVGARSLAMTLNRLIDRHLDAANPRTAGRHLPTGRLTTGQVVVFASVSLAAMLVAVSQLPAITWWLWPVPVALFVIYPYTKRTTWACHLVLGLSIGIAPVGGWIAVTGSFALAPILLWFAVALWIAGFDVIYALLDVAHDRASGTHSLPAQFGEATSLRVAAVLHGLAATLLAVAGLAASVTWPFYVGVIVCTIVLAAAHVTIRPADDDRIQTAFTVMGGVTSLVFLAGVIVAVGVA
ncbi:MAG: 4-hydroxybenzoate octaprenyltransferase [Thermoleophilia bacterium]|nr:4-hydroxybenzoate octaprenyltransferase [Thermoleophilia bacterium]